MVVASELLEEATRRRAGDEPSAEPEPAMARFRITRAQAAAFVERAHELMRGGPADLPAAAASPWIPRATSAPGPTAT